MHKCSRSGGTVAVIMCWHLVTLILYPLRRIVFVQTLNFIKLLLIRIKYTQFHKYCTKLKLGILMLVFSPASCLLCPILLNTVALSDN